MLVSHFININFVLKNKLVKNDILEGKKIEDLEFVSVDSFNLQSHYFVLTQWLCNWVKKKSGRLVKQGTEGFLGMI